MTTGKGLSPRVRGNHRLRDPEPDISGSIPTCAGEPIHDAVDSLSGRVYPRVCGGTRGDKRCRTTRLSGSIPACAGEPGDGPQSESVMDGSIPACAGEPAAWVPHNAFVRVYPRVCGGTWRCRLCPHPDQGLSPRVRGNPAMSVCVTPLIRSIPACAGEPMSRFFFDDWYRVYPRVCGGTALPPICAACTLGLSPRVRGNPPDRRRGDR